MAAKQNTMMKKYFDRGTRPLTPLNVGDRVRIQNNTTVRRIHWDLTGTVTQVKRDRQYVIMVDGSRRLTTRNRRHLRRIPDPINLEEPRRTEYIPVPAPSPAATGPVQPAAQPEPVPQLQPAPAPADPAPPEPIPEEPVPQTPTLAEPVPQLTPIPAAEEPPVAIPPRRSTRPSNQPQRLEMRLGGKSHGEAAQVTRSGCGTRRSLPMTESSWAETGGGRCNTAQV